MLEQHEQSFSKMVVLQIYCLYIRVDCEGGLYVQVSRVQATRAVSLPDVLEEGGSGRVGNKERSSGRRSKSKVGRHYHQLPSSSSLSLSSSSSLPRWRGTRRAVRTCCSCNTRPRGKELANKLEGGLLLQLRQKDQIVGLGTSRF